MKTIDENLIIYGTSETPEVIMLLDGSFIVRGRCVPDDADFFFIPIIRFLERHEKNNKPVFLTFHLDYYNTASYKWLTRMFTIMKEISKHNKVKITWEYLDIDEDLEEVGQELKEMYNLDMKLVEIKSKNKYNG